MSNDFELSAKESVGFVARVKENRKYVEVCSLLSDEVDLGELTLITDSKVYLYAAQRVDNKRGNVHYKDVLVEHPFRLLIARSKCEPQGEYWFVSDDFELSAKEITDAYRRRWDIEVFFSVSKTRT